ncbi:aldose 1-epimerase [Nitrospira sp.]|nr:aldose 1-epimerase [Nitrospira sp.]
MTPPITSDSEITLAFGNRRAVVSPWGGALRRYFFVGADGGETDLVWGYSGGSQKKGGQGDVLIPFPGRIADGRYTFDGHVYQLERNDKEGPNAIHGFVRNLPWRVLRAERAEAEFQIRLEAEEYGCKGYPFSLVVRVTYAVSDAGLSCAFEVTNVGTQAAPVGVGFHPYFTVGTEFVDDAWIRIPGAGYLESNERLVPTGSVIPVAGTEWDFRGDRPIGVRRFNHCYVQLERDREGAATASLRNPVTGRVIDVVMDRSFSAVVVYTGDAIASAARRALAIEPMTCASDAFNYPDWGLQRMLPHAGFAGRYVVRHHVEPSGLAHL